MGRDDESEVSIEAFEDENDIIDKNSQVVREIFPINETFCVKDYCKEILSWFQQTPSHFRRRRFRFCLENHPKWRFKKTDVCRLFLATLHLANAGNISIESCDTNDDYMIILEAQE